MIIDVEGAEEAVLRSIDLSRRRPWVIVAEATEPQSTTPAHQGWEPLLTAADYRFTQFDGFSPSRFYVAAEKWDELHEALERPASPQDDFVHYRRIELDEEIAALTEDPRDVDRGQPRDRGRIGGRARRARCSKGRAGRGPGAGRSAPERSRRLADQGRRSLGRPRCRRPRRSRCRDGPAAHSQPTCR